MIESIRSLARVARPASILLAYWAVIGVVSVGLFFSPLGIKDMPTWLLAIFFLAGLMVVAILNRRGQGRTNGKASPFPNREYRKWLLLIAVVGILIRIGWIVMYAPVQSSDFRIYWDSAVGLVEDGRYAVEFEHLENTEFRAYRSPGYPLFLAFWIGLFGAEWWIPSLSNMGLFLLAVWLVDGICRRTGSRGLSVFASGALAVWPTYWMMTGLANSELLSVTVYLGILHVLLRMPDDNALARAFGLGALVGFGALVKPSLLAFPVLIAVIVLFQTESVTRAAKTVLVVLVGMSLVVLPWSLRNYAVLGTFVLISTNGGFNLYRANNPLATGTWMEQGERDLSGFYGDEVALNRAGFSHAREWIVNNPGAFLRLAFRKLVIFSAVDNSGAKWVVKKGLGMEGVAYDVWQKLSNLWWMVMLWCVLFSLIRNRSFLRTRVDGFLILIMLLFFVVVHMVFESQPRYHMPLLGILSIVAAAAFHPFALHPEPRADHSTT